MAAAGDGSLSPAAITGSGLCFTFGPSPRQRSEYLLLLPWNSSRITTQGQTGAFRLYGIVARVYR